MIRTASRKLAEPLRDHMRAHASNYFPQIQGHLDDVQIISYRRRQFADVFVINIKAGGEEFCVLAKAALPDTQFGSVPEADSVSTRFLSTPDPIGSEFQAMSRFARDVEESGDDRLFAVRVLDSILDDRVLLLEMAQAESLDRHLTAASRLGMFRDRDFLLEAIRRAGVCLRTLHALPCHESRRQRGDSRDDFIAWIDAAERYVADNAHASAYFARVCPRMIALAGGVLGNSLPVGPLHDDFAPRNVLVNAQGQVALIDMLEEWTGCVWEDIGQFLAAISANKLQALSGGRAFAPQSITAMREAFLSGYYQDETIPRVEIAMYEAQTLLTQWASQRHRLTRASRWRNSLKQMRLAASRRWYENCIEKCLTFAERDGAGTEPKPQPQALVAEGAV